MTLSSVWPAVAGSMSAFMPDHLSIQMFVVLQAPMLACALHYDTIECLASGPREHDDHCEAVISLDHAIVHAPAVLNSRTSALNALGIAQRCTSAGMSIGFACSCAVWLIL